MNISKEMTEFEQLLIEKHGNDITTYTEKYKGELISDVLFAKMDFHLNSLLANWMQEEVFLQYQHLQPKLYVGDYLRFANVDVRVRYNVV